MNILVPDSLLREYLDTKATPKQIKEYLSLCGPSVERIHDSKKDAVYDIEITTNRPDSMSVIGVAREAAAILPRFGIHATFLHNPYSSKGPTLLNKKKVEPFEAKKLSVTTDPILNPRWTSVVLDNVRVRPSPRWLVDLLEKTGVRAINTIVDITNYLMLVYGQPAHAFDFDTIGRKHGIPTMILRASKKGEKITTLDGTAHILPGDDIVIEDGTGRLIDLCGIMGGKNSAITEKSTRVMLFLQTYDPMHIRRTSMALGHRTQAATLFEKGIDTELVLPALYKGVQLIADIAGGNIASKLYDIYPKPFKPYTVSVPRQKVDAYLGIHLPESEIKNILTPLELHPTITNQTVSVLVPSFRRDITIDVDIIEEIARIYGYHSIYAKLPQGEPPVVIPDKTLAVEQEIKIRLRDWGYTELYTYSMISEELMDMFGLDKKKSYKIANPLSKDWEYMRPNLLASVLSAVAQNINVLPQVRLFEVSMTYEFSPGDLPHEKPTLVVVWTGKQFYQAKGIALALFKIFGISTPTHTVQPSPLTKSQKSLGFGEFGMVGEIADDIVQKLHISSPITILQLDIQKMSMHATRQNAYIPVPKFPPSFEDLALVVTPQTPVGNLMDTLKRVHPLIADITLLDSHKDTRTIHVTYQSNDKNLTSEIIKPIREKLLSVAREKFGAELKTT